MTRPNTRCAEEETAERDKAQLSSHREAHNDLLLNARFTFIRCPERCLRSCRISSTSDTNDLPPACVPHAGISLYIHNL